MATPEENVKMVFQMYKHFHRKSGQVLFAKDIQAYMQEQSLDKEEFKSGVIYGYEQKWFEDGPNGSIRLTAEGFAKL